MKVPSHLIGLYHKSLRRYKKLTCRLSLQRSTSAYQYQVLWSQLKKLRKKIEALRFQLKIASATGVIVLGLALGTANAQTSNGPFNLQTRSQNPLREPFWFHGNTYPAVVDLDKDGDFDLVVGEENYYSFYNKYYDNRPLHYLLNVGTANKPLYEEQFGSDNPFNDFFIPGDERGPVFADIDKDNDDDLFVGVDDGTIFYFKNDNGTFVQQTGAWDPVTKDGNPFYGIDFGNSAKLSFADLDKDADLDVIIGSYTTSYLPQPPYYERRSVQYYENDGLGNFSEANAKLTVSPMPTYYESAPVVADLDGDGDVDMVIGSYYNDLQYYRQISPGNFEEQTGPWDPNAKTGNPFDGIGYTNNQPVFVDLDDDNDLDLLVGEGDGDYSYSYPANQIHYFENTGNNVFEERLDLENPVGGADPGNNAQPVLMDIDGDNDLDVLIGNKYEQFASYSVNTAAYYNNDNGVFKRVQGDFSPFINVSVDGIFYHDVADIDGDGDLDIVAGDHYGNAQFFRNDAGEYVHEFETNPFASVDLNYQASPNLVDLDNDQDLDLVINDTYDIYYFKNTGTATAPVYEDALTENPFLGVNTNAHVPFLNLADVDHDGDLDLLVSSYDYDYYSYDYTTRVMYYENTGTASVPEFTLAGQQPFSAIEIENNISYREGLAPFMSDFDADGDLDLFIGDAFGKTHFVKNDNPAVLAAIGPIVLNYNVVTDGPLILQPAITLTDTDNDLLVQATVSITNFQPGDALTFTPQAGISGVYNESNGVLTLKGTGTLNEYQALLRTVAYHFTAPSGGRKKPAKRSIVQKTAEFRIWDSDFTNPKPGTQSLSVIFNGPPEFDDQVLQTNLGGKISFDLKQLISDAEGNLDLASLHIVQQPSSGAFAEIDANQKLIIDYDGVNFTGTDQLTIEVCDDLGECARNIVTIEIDNVSEGVKVFNAVAPNSTGDNLFMRIHNLPEGNKVSIYNRWGDRVFEVENYDNAVAGKRFEGRNNNGNALPSGTYFYRIEIPDDTNLNGPELLTGYLSLKQ